MRGRDMAATAVQWMPREQKTGAAGASMLALCAALAMTNVAMANSAMAQTQASAAAAAAVPAAVDPAANAAAAARLDDIIVTGSRIARSGFEAPTPVSVLGQQNIDQLALTNTGDVLNELTSVRPSLAPTNVGFGNFNVGASVANLRGLSTLSANRTLVLVDGNRFVPSTREGSIDLNLIPALLIERMEVVTGGASAAYGSDAVAGVVNVILNKKLEGVRAQADYGISDEGDGADRHLSLAAGTGFAGGRGHFVFGADYDDQKGIGNCFGRSWCSGAGVVETANGAPHYQIYPDNVGYYMTNGGALRLASNPGLAGSPYANVQFGDGGVVLPFYDGTLQGTTKQYGGTNSPAVYTTNIMVPVERYSLFGHGEYELNDSITAWAEGSYGHVKGTNVGPGVWDFNLNIQSGNPFIPADLQALMTQRGITSINMARIDQDWGLATGVSTGETWRAAGGLKGDVLDGRFHWDAHYSYGHTSRDQTVYNSRIQSRFARQLDAVTDPVTGDPVCRDTLSADPAVRAAAAGCVPINPFGTGQASADAINYSYGTPQYDNLDYTQQAVAANLTGDLFELPAGPVGFAIGGEYRKEKGTLDHNEFSNNLDYWQNFGKSWKGTTAVTEGYIEASVPILKDSPVGKSLSLDGAVRQTHYHNVNKLTGDSGNINATTWKISGIYDATDWLRFRATRSRDIRAPNMNELYSASGSTISPYLNPFTGNIENPFVGNGGSVSLDAERGDTTTIGMVLQPRIGDARLHASVDYYNVVLHGALGNFGAQNLLTQCYTTGQLCDHIVLGAGNTLVAIYDTSVNLNKYKTRGLDFELGYDMPVGDDSSLSAHLMATRALDQTSTLGGAAINRLGVTGPEGFFDGGSPGVPKWVLSGTLTYQTGPAQVTLQGRYVSKGKYNATWIGPDDSRYQDLITACAAGSTDPNCKLTVNDNTVDSAFYLNLSGSFAIINTDAHKVEFFGSINNLLARKPPVAPDAYYTNATYFDQIGRYYRLGIRVKY